MALTILLHTLWIVATPLLQAVLGERIVASVSRLSARFSGGVVADVGLLPCYVIGLLLHVSGAFLLRLLGLPWFLAAFIPLVFGIPQLKSLNRIKAALIESVELNFILWFGFSLVTGISLFQAVDGIQTPWANNYGDLTFHLGMITSFLFGDNIPPQYPIYAGERLSYPFLVNLWTVILWWPNPTFRILPAIFTFQWMAVWIPVYFFLKGRTHPLLPWAVLLGGGTYFALGENSGQLIGKGAPWTTFISTIWVPQRTAMFGILPLVAALSLFHQFLATGERRMLVLAGLVLGLMPLVHTHFFLVGVLYIALAILFLEFWESDETHSFEQVLSSTVGKAALFGAPLLLSFLYLPWIMGKGGIINFVPAWMPIDAGQFLSAAGSIQERVGAVFSGPSFEDSATVLDTALMWVLNAPAALLLTVILWGVLRRHSLFAPLVILFVIFNFVILAQWKWDQTKIFLGLYVAVVSLWGACESRAARRLSWAAITLIVPAIYEVWTIAYPAPMHTVYTKEAVTRAETIRIHVPSDGIFAAAPNHNSLITLTGRRLFAGYDGTLSSHGLNYGERRGVLQDLGKAVTCHALTLETTSPKNCPSYLLWTDDEKRFWSGSPLPVGVVPVEGLGYLYKIGAPGGSTRIVYSQGNTPQQ